MTAYPGPLSNVPVLDVPNLTATERLVSLPPSFLRDARTGKPPRLPTAVRVGLRGRVLCVRFDGKDSGVVATYTGRDEPLWKEDVFEIFLSPLESPTVYFEFEVNPLGALFDARVESPQLRRDTMRVATEWNCPGFEARVTRRGDATRWSASLRIPLDPLLGGLAPSQWRANFYRVDRGDTDEYSAWSPTLVDPADFHSPERFGVLRLRL
ncbi:MAG TPA: carbohydrate-binding family 9-like protein [Thermoanaerobaculia bacterium]|jgi:hypothetical protein